MSTFLGAGAEGARTHTSHTPLSITYNWLASRSPCGYCMGHKHVGRAVSRACEVWLGRKARLPVTRTWERPGPDHSRQGKGNTAPPLPHTLTRQSTQTQIHQALPVSYPRALKHTLKHAHRRTHTYTHTHAYTFSRPPTWRMMSVPAATSTLYIESMITSSAAAGMSWNNRLSRMAAAAGGGACVEAARGDGVRLGVRAQVEGWGGVGTGRRKSSRRRRMGWTRIRGLAKARGRWAVAGDGGWTALGQ